MTRNIFLYGIEEFEHKGKPITCHNMSSVLLYEAELSHRGLNRGIDYEISEKNGKYGDEFTLHKIEEEQ